MTVMAINGNQVAGIIKGYYNRSPNRIENKKSAHQAHSFCFRLCFCRTDGLEQ